MVGHGQPSPTNEKAVDGSGKARHSVPWLVEFDVADTVDKDFEAASVVLNCNEEELPGLESNCFKGTPVPFDCAVACVLELLVRFMLGNFEVAADDTWDMLHALRTLGTEVVSNSLLLLLVVCQRSTTTWCRAPGL